MTFQRHECAKRAKNRRQPNEEQPKPEPAVGAVMPQAIAHGGHREPKRGKDDGERNNLRNNQPPVEGKLLSSDPLSLLRYVIVHGEINRAGTPDSEL